MAYVIVIVYHSPRAVASHTDQPLNTEELLDRGLPVALAQFRQWVNGLKKETGEDPKILVRLVTNLFHDEVGLLKDSLSELGVLEDWFLRRSEFKIEESRYRAVEGHLDVLREEAQERWPDAEVKSVMVTNYAHASGFHYTNVDLLSVKLPPEWTKETARAIQKTLMAEDLAEVRDKAAAWNYKLLYEQSQRYVQQLVHRVHEQERQHEQA